MKTSKERHCSAGLEETSHFEYYNHEKMNSANNLNVLEVDNYPFESPGENPFLLKLLTSALSDPE